MDKVVAIIEKNALEQIQVAVKEYQGRVYADLRLFFLGEDEGWHPTKRGLTVSPVLWPEFMAAMARVDKHLPAHDHRPRPSKPGKRP